MRVPRLLTCGPLAFIGVLFGAQACDSHLVVDEERARDAASETAVSSPVCGNAPSKIIDFVTEIPDAGRSGVSMPPLRASDSDLVYELNWSPPVNVSPGPGGAVMRLRLGRTTPVRLAVVIGGGSGSGQGLAITSSSVIFSENGRGDAGAGAIVSSPLSGGEPTILAPSRGGAHALAVDDLNVYFVDDDGMKRVSQTGANIVTLSPSKPYSLTVLRGTVYMADLSARVVDTVPTGGGPTSILTDDADGPVRIIPCGETVCWTTGPPLAGNLKQAVPGSSPNVLARGLSEPHEIVFTGRSFFLTAGSFGSVLYRIPATGGDPVAIAGSEGMNGVAVNDDCLYYSSASGIYAWSLGAAESAPSIGQ